MKIKNEKIRKVIRQVECRDCGAEEGKFCINKSTGLTIKGVHRGRKWLAFAEGLIIVDDDSSFGWTLP